MAVKQVGVRCEQLEYFGEAAGGETIVAADARAFLETDGRGEALRGEHLVRDLERFLEADRSAQAMPADLQEDLVGNVVVGGAQQLGENLRKVTRLPVDVDRLQSRGDGSGRDLALHGTAGLLDERGDQLAGILQAHRGIDIETYTALS